jgi:hypothetical protein
MEQEKPQLPERRAFPEANWLVPFETPHSNAVLKGPTPDVGDLPSELCVDENNLVVNDSAWGLDDEQRRRIAAGANIRLSVWQHPIPPLSVEVEPPFCGSCKAAKVFVVATSEYACAGACPDRDERFGPAPVERVNGSDGPPTPLDQAHADFTPAGDDPEVA